MKNAIDYYELDTFLLKLAIVINYGNSLAIRRKRKTNIMWLKEVMFIIRTFVFSADDGVSICINMETAMNAKGII